MKAIYVYSPEGRLKSGKYKEQTLAWVWENDFEYVYELIETSQLCLTLDALEALENSTRNRLPSHLKEKICWLERMKQVHLPTQTFVFVNN